MPDPPHSVELCGESSVAHACCLVWSVCSKLFCCCSYHQPRSVLIASALLTGEEAMISFCRLDVQIADQVSSSDEELFNQLAC